MSRRREWAGNSDVLNPLRGKIEEIPDRGSRGLFREEGQPGSGVTPAKDPCGWHGEDQETMRRDRRSEDCVLELSRSHPAGVIYANADYAGPPKGRSCRCARRAGVPPALLHLALPSWHSDSSLCSFCHDNCTGTACWTPATSRIRGCAKMTIRERASRFAYTDAAFPRTSSHPSRCGLYNSPRLFFGGCTTSDSRASGVHAAEIVE
jgi:hypothetical protein